MTEGTWAKASKQVNYYVARTTATPDFQPWFQGYAFQTLEGEKTLKFRHLKILQNFNRHTNNEPQCETYEREHYQHWKMR